MKGSNKSRWAAVLVVAIVAGAAYWFWQGREAANSGAPTASGARQQGPGGGRPGRFGAALAPVQAATATSEAVPRYLSGLGTVTAANTVTVRSRVDGQLLAIHFTEGQQVKAGDLLAEIDPSQFKVALAQAEGQLAKDRATPPTPVAIWRATSSWSKPIWFPGRNWTPSSRWSAKPRVRSKRTKPPSPAPSCSWTGAASPRQSTAGSA